MTDNIVGNINLGVNTKQKYSIDGDQNKVIELDPRDMTIIDRIDVASEKILEAEAGWKKLNDIDEKNMSDQDLERIKEQLHNAETQMREAIDYLFDSDVCEIILGKTSCFSPVNGKFKYELIIDCLSSLYESTVGSEMKKINKRKIEKHTAKYVKSGK